jgi:hypothetical protein
MIDAKAAGTHGRAGHPAFDFLARQAVPEAKEKGRHGTGPFHPDVEDRTY